MRRQFEQDSPPRRDRFSLLKKILMITGILALIYFFITEVLMRLLAALTPS
jgi:hypothetical protein